MNGQVLYNDNVVKSRFFVVGYVGYSLLVFLRICVTLKIWMTEK